MGATENVYVEQLVARESIEELIVEMNKRENPTLDPGRDSTNDNNLNRQDKTIGFLLSNAKLIRPRKIRGLDIGLEQQTKRKKRRVQFA
jgi:hypothetical protein